MLLMLGQDFSWTFLLCSSGTHTSRLLPISLAKWTPEARTKNLKSKWCHSLLPYCFRNSLMLDWSLVICIYKMRRNISWKKKKMLSWVNRLRFSCTELQGQFQNPPNKKIKYTLGSGATMYLVRSLLCASISDSTINGEKNASTLWHHVKHPPVELHLCSTWFAKSDTRRARARKFLHLQECHGSLAQNFTELKMTYLETQ